MRCDVERQFCRETTDPVLTCNLHTVITDCERNLTSGLYSYTFEFKHQNGITLDLFADSAYHNRFRA